MEKPTRVNATEKAPTVPIEYVSNAMPQENPIHTAGRAPVRNAKSTKTTKNREGWTP